MVAGTTRRSLLVAGAGLAVAGCGSQEREVPPDAELLAPSLAAALALADAYERAGGRLGRELAQQRIRRGGDDVVLLPAPRQQRHGAAGEQRAPRHHQTVESRFSISSTGRV